MKSANVIAVLSVALFTWACGGDVEPKAEPGVDITTNNGASDAGTDSGERADMSIDVPDATRTSDLAPAILELRVAPSTLSSGESVIVTAIVSDPDGPGDIAAGSLVDPQSMQQIANFETISAGAFEAEVTWDALNRIRPIMFGPAGAERAVTAEFIDFGNERGTRSTTIALTCNGASACGGICGLDLCGGTCVDPNDAYATDGSNCGSCGNVCPADRSCRAGQCIETVIGAACQEHTDCEGEIAVCAAAEFDDSITYCSALCEKSTDCGPGASCTEYSAIGPGGGFGSCLPTCDTAADCREQFECTDAPELEGGFVTVCTPSPS